MINDVFELQPHNAIEPSKSQQSIDGDKVSNEGPSDQSRDFVKLVKEESQKLYEGYTKYSKLSFVVKLYHIKCLCGISNKVMSMILELLKDAFSHARIPESYYKMKKIINKLSLNYTKVYACLNDCMSYWGEDASKESCKKCHTSR